ncbi:MAG: formyltransferase family protein [bacterium]|nr:formyltransferase family protein [bacterium]
MASGSGTTFGYLARHVRTNVLPFDGCVLVHTRARCGAVDRARELQVETRHWSRAQSLTEVISPGEFPLVVLAGCLRVLQPAEVAPYGLMLNTHPGPLPEFGGKGFYGIHVHAAVLRYLELTGQHYTCATVHQVSSEIDAGRVMGEHWLRLADNGCFDPDEVAETLLPFEHLLIGTTLLRLTAGEKPDEISPASPRQLDFSNAHVLQEAREYGLAYQGNWSAVTEGVKIV